ncbi:unnamed protein product [marine sediment metagenome]|uniref:Uncharacterized protein n=1 Tax=marine sediment metagenome TaxID=412755 RepID=X0XAI1_9ZZZZ
MSVLLDQIELDTPTYFSGDDFGVPLVWSGQSIYCLFDDEYIPVGDEGTGPVVSSNNPVARIHSADLPLLAVNDTVTVNSVDWVVRDIQEDTANTGDALLILSK